MFDYSVIYASSALYSSSFTAFKRWHPVFWRADGSAIGLRVGRR